MNALYHLYGKDLRNFGVFTQYVRNAIVLLKKLFALNTSSNTQVISVSKVSISNDDDEEPTTSSAAAVRVQMRSVEEDTDDSSLSLNALNGTRRPDYQPIPRRREIQHRDPNIQNIYLSGITGG
ncbi:uncharacterized protein LOC119682474 [Teleopsis dalmanni]|uniref:uncharacterized protein LOC119682474 n=1 Tax=Teleopsis dalmanni TaxID=139649 RepID=UPI0018CF4124|nr:uncharacterized protein LOC119682474 [Teleopsis dalmanni]